MSRGLYIHIPFCERKCFYCDFLSFASREADYAAYVSALVNELDGGDFDTIYLGGGTPSVLPPELISAILRALKASALETTIEVNPGTVTPESFAAYRAMGINRLSFGLQSADDGELRMLGRIHGWQEFLESFRAAREAGFGNISIDLMYSLPGQKISGWRRTLERVMALEPEHISAYGLTFEENTKFGRLLASGELRETDENADREMYAAACKALAANGYPRYEISSFAKAGFESRHNIKYWTRAEYLGVGLGAHSFVNETRWRNTRDLDRYIAGGDVRRDILPLQHEQAMAEFIFLGLRMSKGVSEAEFYTRFGRELREVYGAQIKKHTSGGMLIADGGRIFLSERGVDVSNRVMADFII